ncbi:CpaB family protein [Aliidiomarina indica]|uniref:hypothetical protein n=1 Tax=Aliidiomarina indica TaxID=2749147 RepID=UPI00188F4FB1|nr:hypothetical protein [Aliidiomarina indica]
MKLVMGKKFWWPLALGTLAALFAWYLLGQYRTDLETRFVQLMDSQEQGTVWIDVVVSRVPLQAGDTLELGVLQYRRMDASMVPVGAIYPEELSIVFGQTITLAEHEQIAPGQPLQWYQLSGTDDNPDELLPANHTLLTLAIQPEDSHIGLWSVDNYIQGYQQWDSRMRKVGRPFLIYALDGERLPRADESITPRHVTLLLSIHEALQLASAATQAPLRWFLVHRDEQHLPTMVTPPQYIQRLVPQGEACLNAC